MKSTTSPARIEANRRNAKKSTGPRTSEGKNVVKWNALKHGLLSREIVITVGAGAEDKAEYESLINALQEELKPVGILEQMLVEKIAVCYWRLRRALRCEVGMIQENIEPAEFRSPHDKRPYRLKNWDHSSASYEYGIRSNMITTSSGCEAILMLLGDIRSDIESSGKMTAEDLRALRLVFGRSRGKSEYPLEFHDLFADVSQWEEVGFHLEVEEKDVMLNMLHREEASHKVIADERRPIDQMKHKSEMARLAIPGAVPAERIQRYETGIERQLYRALDRLERLQRQRQGDAVPPPLNIELSGSN